MISRIVILLIAAAAAELYVLIQLGQRFGLGSTLLLIVATALTGTWLARREGVGVWSRFQEALAHGKKPDAEILDGVIIMASAALLLLPGILSDIVGLFGLLPFTRPILRKELARRLKSRGMQGGIRVGFGNSDQRRPRTPSGSVDAGQTQDAGQRYTTTFGGAARDRPAHATDD
jgi:UPF0716 protein FxsA